MAEIAPLFFSGKPDTCPKMFQICFKGGFCLEKFVILPTAVIGLAIGLAFGIIYTKPKTKSTSDMFYSLTFYLFGAMTVVSAVLHCVVHDDGGPDWMAIIRITLMIIEFALTSNVAVNLALAGLADIKIWDWSKKYCRILSILLWVGLVFGWFVGMFTGKDLYMYLYVILFALCTVIWFICQLSLFQFSMKTMPKKAMIVLILGLVLFVIGLIMNIDAISNMVCKILKSFAEYVSPMAIWYYFLCFAFLLFGLFLSFTKSARPEAQKFFLPE